MKTLERFKKPEEVIVAGLVKSRAMDLEEAVKDLSSSQKAAVKIHVRNEEIERDRGRERGFGHDFTL